MSGEQHSVQETLLICSYAACQDSGTRKEGYKEAHLRLTGSSPILLGTSPLLGAQDGPLKAEAGRGPRPGAAQRRMQKDSALSQPDPTEKVGSRICSVSPAKAPEQQYDRKAWILPRRLKGKNVIRTDFWLTPSRDNRSEVSAWRSFSLSG